LFRPKQSVQKREEEAKHWQNICFLPKMSTLGNIFLPAEIEKNPVVVEH